MAFLRVLPRTSRALHLVVSQTAPQSVSPAPAPAFSTSSGGAANGTAAGSSSSGGGGGEVTPPGATSPGEFVFRGRFGVS